MERVSPTEKGTSDEVAFEAREGVEKSAGAVLPVLSEVEVLVLGALAERGIRLTLSQLASCTGVSREELGMAIGGLRAKGLISRLNTVVESYSCRFPGVRVDDL